MKYVTILLQLQQGCDIVGVSGAYNLIEFVVNNEQPFSLYPAPDSFGVEAVLVSL